jgi:hypothetical protein
MPCAISPSETWVSVPPAALTSALTTYRLKTAMPFTRSKRLIPLPALEWERESFGLDYRKPGQPVRSSEKTTSSRRPDSGNGGMHRPVPPAGASGRRHRVTEGLQRRPRLPLVTHRNDGYNNSLRSHTMPATTACCRWTNMETARNRFWSINITVITSLNWVGAGRNGASKLPNGT